MSNGKLRVGIIGIGVYAVLAHVPELRATGKADVVAIARRDPDRLAMAQEKLHIPEAYTDWREMLARSRLDAVVVCTPHHLHTEPTLAALAQGLHVLVAKPMALTSKDAWSMVNAAQQAQKILMVGYPNRLAGIWQTVKQVVATGAIGQLRQINLATCDYRRWFWENDRLPADVQQLLQAYLGMPDAFFADWGLTWHRNPAEMGGGAFTDLGTHAVDRLLWLAGAPAVEVVAFTEKGGMPAESFVNVQARLANGVLLSFSWADAVPRDLLSGDRHLMIIGDKGLLTDDADKTLWLFRDGERKKLEAAFPARTEAAAFVAAILEGDQTYPQAHEGAYAVDFVEAMYRSAAEGRIVQLKPKEGYAYT